MTNNLLHIENLSIGFLVKKRKINIINNISMDIAENEIVGVIGETGCGKSVTGSAILHLLPDNAVISGSIEYKGMEIAKIKDEEYRKLRGSEIASIPQSPSTSLDPIMRIGGQVTECVTKRPKFKGKYQAIKEEVVQIFARLKVGDKHIYNRYPCELSGGMCQRVLISMGALTHPSLLVIDEPTKAIDWVLRKEVTDVLRELRDSMNCAMMMITHDIGVAKAISDRIIVMYAGEIVEVGTVEEVINHPKHPYTVGLIGSLPSNGFKVMNGFMPSFEELPKGCRFSDRCVYATDKCKLQSPKMHEISSGNFIKCHRYKEID